LLYDRDDTALLIWQHPLRPVPAVTIGTSDPAALAELSSTFSTKLGLIRV
jgi:hypothetical protein